MLDRTSWRAQVQAWAKINLDLRILAREASGFHQLETVFQRISLADLVTVEVRAGTGITLQCVPAVPVPDTQNLAWRAADAYRQVAGWPLVDHEIVLLLEKAIPTGGGLGGGSADAGAVLRALNALNPTPLPSPTLLTIAATLGADVPFLTTECCTALAWGRGERLLALPSLPARHVQLATFREGVNTAVAYRELAAARENARLVGHGSAMHDLRMLADWDAVGAGSHNDFEVPVFTMRPDIATVHAAWRSAAPEALVRMSGSGATVVAVTAGPHAALTAAAERWPDDDHVQVLHATTLDHVPPVAILSAPSGPR